MKPEMTDFHAFAINLVVEGEVCDLPHAKVGMQAAHEEMAPLIQELEATRTAEIEGLIAELQEAKGHLQSERERIEQETSRIQALRRWHRLQPESSRTLSPSGILRNRRRPKPRQLQSRTTL